MTRSITELALFTDDVATAKSFYARILGYAPAVEWPGGAVFSATGTKLLVHERAGAQDDGSPPNEDHFALAVSDVDAACDALRAAGVDLLVEPRDFPWGRSAYLRDPDGRLVELAQA